MVSDTFSLYRKYLLYLQFNASGSFLQKCIDFVEQRRKFPLCEGSIIKTRQIYFYASDFSGAQFYLHVCLRNN